MSGFVIVMRQGTLAKNGNDYSNTWFLEAKAEGAFKAFASESCEGKPGAGDVAAMLTDLKAGLKSKQVAVVGALAAIDALPAGNAGIAALLATLNVEKTAKTAKTRRVATGK